MQRKMFLLRNHASLAPSATSGREGVQGEDACARGDEDGRRFRRLPPSPRRKHAATAPPIYDGEEALLLRSSTFEVTDDFTSSILSETLSMACESLSCSSIFAVMP